MKMQSFRNHPAKFHNKKVQLPSGEVFDSQGECRRWQELRLMEMAGKIHNLQRQVTFELIPNQRTPSGRFERKISYIADFVYEADGKQVVEDYKGFKTPEYRIKKKLLLYRYGIELLETKR